MQYVDDSNGISIIFSIPSSTADSQGQILNRTKCTFLYQNLSVFLIVLPSFGEVLRIIFRICIFQFINNFLHKSSRTIFSLRIPLVSAFLYLALSSRKVYLFEGMVRGMILMVLRMGSV
jgi:hypothetical protein